jgi:hypothetical protein
MGKSIIEAAKSIRDIINDEDATLKFLNYTAWCMSIGAFLGVVEAPQIEAMFIMSHAAEEDDDEPVH